MKFLMNIFRFLLLNQETKFLLFEAFVHLAWARIQKMRPFSKVAPQLGEQMEETPQKTELLNHSQLKKVAQAIHIMSKYTFWESQCLVKAIAGMKMLERRKIESTLYLGTGRDEDGKMIAHAWLRSGTYYVSGSEGMERFTIVSMFAKRVRSNQ